MTTPAMLSRDHYRQRFADYLDRFAAGSADVVEWQRYVVMHYPDEFLEEIRRCVVRLGIEPYTLDSDEGKNLLRAWAVALRLSIVPDDEELVDDSATMP